MRFAHCLALVVTLLGAATESGLAASAPLTKADGQSQDAVGEVSANSAGFVVGWVRTKLSPSFELSVRARQYTAAGVATGKELVFDKRPSMLTEPIILPTGDSKVAAFWLRPQTGLIGRLGDLATGNLSPEKTLLASGADLIAESNAEVVRLTNGRFLAMVYKFDTSSSPLSKRLAVALIGSDLKVLKPPVFVPGPKASYVATAASDFTAVPLAGGGALVAYRNRLDGAIYAVPISAAGVPANAAIKINQKTAPLGVAGQQTEFEVEGTRLSNGNVVVVWTRIGGSDADDAFDISFRILSPAGVAVGTETVAHASLRDSQLSPEVVALPSSAFAISWTNNGQPEQGRPRSYVLRKFSASGAPAAAAQTLLTGPRGLNSQSSELVQAGSKVMLVTGSGSSVVTLQGILANP